MVTFDIYLEEADTDAERRFLGRLDADTQSDALDLAAQFYEVPQHDLAAVPLLPGIPRTAVD